MVKQNPNPALKFNLEATMDNFGFVHGSSNYCMQKTISRKIMIDYTMGILILANLWTACMDIKILTQLLKLSLEENVDNFGFVHG